MGANHLKLGEAVKAGLSDLFPLRQLDLGADARLSKKGMTFTTEAYAVGDVGHLCVMNMKAMLGLMKMETVVLSVTGRDLPLFNLDWVGVMGKETQFAELYDDQLEPLSEEALGAFQALLDRDGDLPDYHSPKTPWYEPIRYACSYAKTGKGLAERMDRAAKDYLAQYLKLLAAAPVCDREAKTAKVRDFAQTLFEKGGPAVDQVIKLFGTDVARRLVLQHMYGM